MENDYDSYDIYLKKDNYIVGLHSVGFANSTWDLVGLDGSVQTQTGFQAFESWGNFYDENYKIQGRGSFRVFSSIDDEAKAFEEDGWVRFERIV